VSVLTGTVIWLALVGVLRVGPTALRQAAAPKPTAASTAAAQTAAAATRVGATHRRSACAGPLRAGQPVTVCRWCGESTGSVCRPAAVWTSQEYRQTGPAAGAAAFDGALRDVEQSRGIGHRVAVHIHCHYGVALRGRQPQ